MKTAPDKFGISFGPLCESIHAQLKAQGLKFDAEKVKRVEALREAANRLVIGLLLPDSVSGVIYKKLMAKISAAVKG